MDEEQSFARPVSLLGIRRTKSESYTEYVKTEFTGSLFPAETSCPTVVTTKLHQLQLMQFSGDYCTV